MDNRKTPLIVTGVAHSGVSTVAALLNCHPGICLGVRRFPDQYFVRRNFSPVLFTRERFLDVRRGDAGHAPDAMPRPAHYYDDLAARWPAARLVGDSLDDLTPVLGNFMTAVPEARFVFVLRNLKDVAMTGQAEAEDGFAAACRNWATQYGMLHDMLHDSAVRRRLFLLDHDQLLDEESTVARALLEFLDLEPDAAFAEAMQKQRTHLPNHSKTGRIPAANVETYKAVDQDAARALRKLARSEVDLRVCA